MDLNQALDDLKKNHHEYSQNQRRVIGIYLDSFIGFVILEITYCSTSDNFTIILTGGYPYNIISLFELHHGKQADDLKQSMFMLKLQHLAFNIYKLKESTKNLQVHQSLSLLFPDLVPYQPEYNEEQFRHFLIEAKIRIDETNKVY